MNVLHVTGMSFPTKFGGFEKWLTEICRTVSSYGHKMFISYSKHLGNVTPFFDEIEQCGGEILVLSDDSHIETFCVENNIKVVHFHFDFTGYKSLYRNLKKMHIGLFAHIHCENYYYIHHNWKRTPLIALRVSGHRIKTFFVSKYFAQIFACSYVVFQQYKEFYFWPASKFSLLYLGLSSQDVCTHHANNKIPTIACIAFHSPVKGIDILLKALSILKMQNIPFTCLQIGGGSSELNGEDTNALKELCHSLDLDSQLTWVGLTNDVYRYLSISDIYCQPSRTEALPLSIAEAMQASLPIIASGVGGVSELVHSGENGFTVQPDDPVALAEKLKLLISDNELRQKMGARSKLIIKEMDFSHSTSAGKLYSHYKKYLD